MEESRMWDEEIEEGRFVSFNSHIFLFTNEQDLI